MLDYNEFDSISLVLKRDVLENMLSYYSELGWREYERYEDKKYFDLIHLTLVRSHKIENKDRLQLLQVRLEAAVNRIGVDRKYKHSRSTVLGLSVLAASVVFITAAIGFGFFSSYPWRTPVSISALVLGVLIPAVFVSPFCRLIRKEKDLFLKKYKKNSAEIICIIEDARRLGNEE